MSEAASDVRVRPARREEAATLTAIAFAAKRHWGYPESWIQRWAPLLTITPTYLAAQPTWVAEASDEVVGFCALVFERDTADLEHLWVLPSWMRRGIGARLFAAAEAEARRRGVRRLTIDSDPHAEGFYVRMGAQVTERIAAPMDGQARFLPVLLKEL